jgi:hypothetical protein
MKQAEGQKYNSFWPSEDLFYEFEIGIIAVVGAGMSLLLCFLKIMLKKHNSTFIESSYWGQLILFEKTTLIVKRPIIVTLTAILPL